MVYKFLNEYLTKLTFLTSTVPATSLLDLPRLSKGAGDPSSRFSDLEASSFFDAENKDAIESQIRYQQ
jgi:hypothetical protein